jgi:hypothetical protein
MAFDFNRRYDLVLETLAGFLLEQNQLLCLGVGGGIYTKRPMLS